MTQIHIIIKSFQWYQIKNTILFIKKMQSLLNHQNDNLIIKAGKNPLAQAFPALPCKATGELKKKQSFFKQKGFYKINKMSCTNFPKKRKLFTVLRSPHIDKKSREQFQFVFYKLKLILNEKNDNKINLFIFLLKNSEFPGVEMEIVLNYHSCLHFL